jgi:hypothetical protein
MPDKTDNNRREQSWQEKREERFQSWLDPDFDFPTPEIKAGYRARATRLMQTIKMEIPDRVPVMIPAGSIVAYNAGMTLQDILYDYDKLKQGWLKFIADYDLDAMDSPALIFPARVYEIMDYRAYKWPGHGLPSTMTLHQFVERDYMRDDEYGELLRDQLDYELRYFLPRSWGVFEPLAGIPSFSSFRGLPMRLLAMCQEPEFRKLFRTIWKASQEFARWEKVVKECQDASYRAGFPLTSGGITLAPFDSIADMLRGTQGAVMDMYRQPEKLLEALEAIWPNNVESAVTAATANDCPMVFIPMHKGDDVFMSDQQYEKFYWPTFRKMLLGIIEEGCVPYMVVDGSYNRRLEIIKDLPRASVVWIFEQTDMARAKKVLGDSACIGGNVRAAQLYTHTVADIKDYCRWLIETCGPGGGYILSLGSGIDRCDPAKLQAIIDAAKEYGVYS